MDKINAGRKNSRKKVRTRFAPSPTGFMHIGNLRTCLYGYLFAKKNGGDFIVRIEDTDQKRYVEGATELIYKTLAVCGIKIDESPLAGGKYGPYVQSERKPLYKKYAERLVKKGGAYYCFCGHGEEEGEGENADGAAAAHVKGSYKKYDKHCLGLTKEQIAANLKAGKPYVIRQNIPVDGVSEYDDLVYGHIAVPCADMEDQILLKSDGMPTYNFANVVDDRLMKITHVMRGNEYLSSTPKYNLMYDAFGWQRPQYIHLAPIMRDEHHKLSKRSGDANFEDFTAKGYLPEAIINYIALLGWAPKDNTEKMSMSELIDKFDLAGISKSGSIFDEKKAAWLNGEYIKALPAESFAALAAPYLTSSAISSKSKLAALLQTRVEVLSEIPEKVAFIDGFTTADTTVLENAKMKVTSELARAILADSIKTLERTIDFTDENLKTAVVPAIAADGGYKAGQVFIVLRAALTATAITPGGATEMAEVLGKEESLRRLKAWGGRK